jgi:molecular chaperone HtpG
MLDHEPIFGKNVIETLSEGMYDNPLFLFREYVQNAADAIDSAVRQGIICEGNGQIEIVIDAGKRLISLEDNGTGIASSDFKAMLANIGNSIKDRKTDKGFRGIGRLGGLGYCQKVRFETSAMGESVRSFMEWDARNLHELLADQNEKISAGQLIKRISGTWEESCEEDEHYFKVSLVNVNAASDELLDADEVRRYLSMVAPVPFDYERFRFINEIESFIRDNNLPALHEYTVNLNGDEVRKGYETPLALEKKGKMVDILAVECVLLKKGGKTVGWYWFCVSEFDGVLPVSCWQRGFRLRKANIQIGEYDCLSNHPRHGQKLWREDRGNNYFLGEVHALDENLIPNSRRDYFNQDAACRLFEAALCEEFRGLHTLYHDASKIRSAVTAIRGAEIAKKDFQKKVKSGVFYNDETCRDAQEKVDSALMRAREGQSTLEKFRAETQTLPGCETKPVALLVEKWTEQVPTRVLQGKLPSYSVKSGVAHIRSEDRRVLDEVFAVLDKMLPPDTSASIKEAITKRFARV